jgi:hypothetical protein
VSIQVPPESVLKKRRQKQAAAPPARKPYRRRLSQPTTSAPSLTAAMREQAPVLEDAESVREAIQEAMDAASHIGE